MTTTPSIPTEILARIFEFSSPASLAVFSLISRRWNRAARTISDSVALKTCLKLHYLEPERGDSPASQHPDAPPSWLLSIQSTRLLPQYEQENLPIPTPRTILVAMTADININCRAFTALDLQEPSDATRALSDCIRLEVSVLHLDELNIRLSSAIFQVMNSADENVAALSRAALPESSAVLDKAPNLCRLLRIPHLQFDRISYVLWSNTAPPFRGAFLPSVAEMSLVNSDSQPHPGAGLWADDFEIASAVEAFASEKLPFPNAKQLTTPYGELCVTSSKNFRTAKNGLVRLISNQRGQFSVNDLLPNLEEFGAISLALGRMWSSPDHPSIAVLSSLPATVHTIHATIQFTHLFYAASALLDLLTHFSTLLPPPTRRLILTISRVSPTQEDMRPTGRKLLCALVEISKRVVVEVRIEGSGDFPVDYIRMSWKGQLGELECSEVLKSGAVMLRRS